LRHQLYDEVARHGRRWTRSTTQYQKRCFTVAHEEFPGTANGSQWLNPRSHNLHDWGDYVVCSHQQLTLQRKNGSRSIFMNSPKLYESRMNGVVSIHTVSRPPAQTTKYTGELPSDGTNLWHFTLGCRPMKECLRYLDQWASSEGKKKKKIM